MVRLAAAAAASHTFDEKSLRLSLAEIARRSYGDGATVNQALEEGWKQGVSHAMADGIVSQSEEARLREFRDRLALDDGAEDQKATTLLERDPPTGSPWTPGSPPSPNTTPDTRMNEISESLRPSGLNQGQQTVLLEIWPESGGSRVSGYTWSQQA